MRQVSEVMTRPAPIRGINAYDSIVGMGEGYALVLRNFFAQPYGCQVRRGYVQHATGISGSIETLASHNALVPKLYAFAEVGASAEVYDVTEANANPVPLDFTLSNARWQHINFPNPAGVSMIAVNGADNPLWFKPDGTVVQIFEGDGLDGTIKGVDPTKLIHVYSHQKRLWFVEKDSMMGWYMPPDQITGEASFFDFGALFVRGGYLSQIITWTIDDGNGADDHLAAISSEGEVAIYQGTDPNEAATWVLQGVYYVGAPVGRRAACRYGGDIAIVTQVGLVMLSNLLKSTKINPSDDVSGKYVQQLISNAVSATRELFGWQPFVFPGANMFMINIPATTTTFFQFVMNDITKAWSEFIGYQAQCWELHQQLPFFSSQGAVFRAWEGTSDGAIHDGENSVVGEDIRAEAQTAFSYFGHMTINKHFKMVRPNIISSGKFSVSEACNVDFSFDSPLAPASFARYEPGKWDEAYWDAAQWAGGLRTFANWQAVTGIGTVASLRLLMINSAETYWASVDWLFESGGVM